MTQCSNLKCGLYEHYKLHQFALKTPLFVAFKRRKVCLNFEVDHRYFFADDTLVIESLWIEQESHVKLNWLENNNVGGGRYLYVCFPLNL